MSYVVPFTTLNKAGDMRTSRAGGDRSRIWLLTLLACWGSLSTPAYSEPVPTGAFGTDYVVYFQNANFEIWANPLTDTQEAIVNAALNQLPSGFPGLSSLQNALFGSPPKAALGSADIIKFGTVALADGNTIMLDFARDVFLHLENLPAVGPLSPTQLTALVTVAITLLHEDLHRQYGLNGALSSCQHAGAFAESLKAWASAISEIPGLQPNCPAIEGLKGKHEKHKDECEAGGGTAIHPDGGPPAQFPCPMPGCEG